MGSIKRKCSLYDFIFIDSLHGGTTRTVRESQTFFSLIKSCTVTANLMDLVYQEIKRAALNKKEIDRKLILQKVHKLMDETVKEYSQDVNYFRYGSVSFIYDPRLEGGDKYNLNCKALNENQHFEFDVIHVAIGIAYNTIYSNFVRTLLINPTLKVIYNYSFLTVVQKALAFYLRDGVKLCKVYKSAMSVAENVDRHLAISHLDKRFGFALNPILQEDLIIYADSKATAHYGMTFSMNVTLRGLVEAGRVYILCACDTVLVRRDEPAEIITFKDRIRDSGIIRVPNL